MVARRPQGAAACTCSARPRRTHRPVARGHHVRRPGLRQRRLVGRADHAATGCDDGGGLGREQAIRSDSGIDANALHEHIADGGLITEFEGAEPIDAEDLIAVPCDVFIPAALGGMIHEHNVDRMQCKMVVEGANSPTRGGRPDPQRRGST